MNCGILLSHKLLHEFLWPIEFRPEAATRGVLSKKGCNFIKKETLAQVFSCEFYEISKNTFFTEHLRTTASISSFVFFMVLVHSIVTQYF